MKFANSLKAPHSMTPRKHVDNNGSFKDHLKKTIMNP